MHPCPGRLHRTLLIPCRPRNIPRRPHDWKIRSACLKLHSRRVTALDFPPGSVNLVCSADKKGLVAVWDFDEAWPSATVRLAYPFALPTPLNATPQRDVS